MIRAIPLNKLLFSLSILALTGCAANLDSECAELFEDLNIGLDRVLEAELFDEKVERLKALERYTEDIVSLKNRAETKFSQAGPSNKEAVWDDLNRRKAVALNGFNQRRFEIGDDVLKAAGHDDFFDESSFLNEAARLIVICNNTLR